MASVSTSSAFSTSAGSGSTYLGTSQHSLFTAFAASWRLLADAAEGTGGFFDGTNIVAHPREWQDHTAENPVKPTKKLLERRSLARYENWPDTILTLVAGALFRKEATRICGASKASDTSQRHPIELWWGDVDGQGTDIHDWLARVWRPSAVFGHVFVVMDKPQGESATAADQPGQYLRVYTPLDVPDWLTDEQGFLRAISVLEAIPRTTFDQSLPDVQNRWIFTDRWELHTAPGAKTQPAATNGPQNYGGKLPVVVLYGKRRPMIPVVGQSILGDPWLYVDDYNLTSETRELLRKQTFSWINVPLGAGDQATPVEQAQAMMGQQISTGNVLFTPLEAQMLSGETANVTVYQDERKLLQRTMFRLAGLPWEGDSRASESAESRRIKREDLNQTLSTYAKHCEIAEKELTELWFRGTYGEQWSEELEKAQIRIAWPTSFDEEVLDDVIARATMAIGMGLGKTAASLIKKQVVTQLLPGIDTTTKAIIESEIDAMPDAEQQRQQDARARLTRLMGGPNQMGDVEDKGDDTQPANEPANDADESS